MAKWEIIDTGIQNAEENMRFDAELLENADAFVRPVLHFYEWAGQSATYGYFTDPAELLNMDHVKGLSLHLARRSTGGGIVFHIWDMAFSVLVPAHCPEFSMNTLKNYAFVNGAVLASVHAFLKSTLSLSLISEDYSPWDNDCLYFCMAKPTKYDVMWQGKKVAGAAQRKTRKGYLHQGTIALTMPSVEYLEHVLRSGTKVKEAMLAHTYPLLGLSASQQQMDAAKLSLRSLLATHLTQSSVSLITQRRD